MRLAQARARIVIRRAVGQGPLANASNIKPLGEYRTMIIDCHGHYTTAPAELQKFREAQIAGLKDPLLRP
ncbi:MAG TPA: hypothetical protein VIL32_03805, partial [Steroidobacteraceae bacterium]